MHKFFAAVLIAGGFGMSAVGARAMPFANVQTQGILLVSFADGCGIGWHRSPYGGCARDAYGLFGMGFYYVPHSNYPPRGAYSGPAPCNGRGVHNVCDIFGQCRWVCN